MPYVSAKYMPTDPMDVPDMARPIQAIDEQGLVWSFREDSQVGDWLEYIANGGVIDPEDPPPVETAAPNVVYGEPLPE